MMSKEEKRKILAKVIEVAVREIMANDMYQFKGKTYKQTEGGSIGLRATGVIVMNRWRRRLIRTLENEEIRKWLVCKYMEDINMIIKRIKEGWRWDSKTMKLEWKKETEEKDKAELTYPEERTLLLRYMFIQNMNGQEIWQIFHVNKLSPQHCERWDSLFAGVSVR